MVRVPKRTISLRRLVTCNALRASGEFCRMLITFANSLDPVGPDLDLKRFDILMVVLNGFFEKETEKKREKNNSRRLGMQNYQACKE